MTLNFTPLESCQAHFSLEVAGDGHQEPLEIAEVRQGDDKLSEAGSSRTFEMPVQQGERVFLDVRLTEAATGEALCLTCFKELSVEQ